MTKRAGTTSVFTDDSGTRRRVLLWALRGTIGTIALAAAAVVLTLVTHVSLPVLGEPLADLGNGRAPTRGDGPGGAERSDPGPAELPGQSPSAAPTDAVSRTGSGQGPASSRPSSVPAATTPPAAVAGPSSAGTPGSKANRGAASTDAPRATPTSNPHAPEKTPPGRTK